MSDETTRTAAMSDKEVAIAHLTLGDAETVQDVKKWRAHWRLHFDNMAVSKHSGDCTKQCWTCSRCLTDDALKMVPVYRELFETQDP